MNIVLVISDTLRRDHLGCYGNEWIHTPNLDRFAAESAVFEDAYEASFPTMPTRADHFTGKLTLTYLAWEPLHPGETTLAQLLQRAGYFTMAVIDTPFHIRQEMNYDRGFSDFIWVRGQGWFDRSDCDKLRRHEEDYCAPRTFREAEKWLERNYTKRFFLLIDTWDPHEPWDPPSYYARQYMPDYDASVTNPVYRKYRGVVSERGLKVAHAGYCGEITMVDFWFGRFMQRLDSLGLRDNTAVIFVSDHGFYFGEHGQFGKGEVEGASWVRSPLYDEVTRVPLIVSLPGAKPKRVPGLVCQPDLFPTILELAGAKPPEDIYGKSILPLTKGRRKALHDVVITSWPLYGAGFGVKTVKTKVVDGTDRTVAQCFASAITDGEWTLLYAAHGEPVELYHTKADPKQKKNLFRRNRAKAAELHARFIATLEAQGTAEFLLAPRRKL